MTFIQSHPTSGSFSRALLLAAALAACDAETSSGSDAPQADVASEDAAPPVGSSGSRADPPQAATTSNAQDDTQQEDDAGSTAAGAVAIAQGGLQTGFPGATGGGPASTPTQPATPQSATPPSGLDASTTDGGAAWIPMLPGAPPVAPVGPLSDGGIDSGISAECDTQLTKCNGVGPDLIRDCVAVVRRCLPVDASDECNAQLDKCEQGKDPLIDCPMVALVCP